MKILIIDDSKTMRMIVRRMMRQAGFGDHDYEQADDGDKGYQKIMSWQPDLVLSDWNMPAMNGLELLQKLHAEGNPVVFGFITSEGSVEMRERAERHGAKFLISKPFTADTIHETLAGFLSS